MWDREKPPLRKGRCQPNRLTEGSLGDVSIVLRWWLLLRSSDPSVKDRRSLTALSGPGPFCPLRGHFPRYRGNLPLTQGSFFAVDGPYYTFDVFCEEQRAMPAYEAPPVLPGPPFFYIYVEAAGRGGCVFSTGRKRRKVVSGRPRGRMGRGMCDLHKRRWVNSVPVW